MSEPQRGDHDYGINMPRAEVTTPLTREERERLRSESQRQLDGETPWAFIATPDQVLALLSTIDSLEERVKELDQAFSSASDSADQLSDRLALMEKVVEAARYGCGPAYADPYLSGTRRLPGHDNDCGISEALAALGSISEEGK